MGGGYLGVRMTGKREWRKLQTETFYDLYSIPNIIWLMKSRMRWAGHVAGMGEDSNKYRD
jgi:hypothetical protein